MTLHYGIMGAASIVPRFIAGVAASKSSKVVAIAARNEKRAQKMANDWQIATVYPDYQTLCAAPEIDVIYIPLYNRAHFNGAKLALENGKNVLLEKPFTLFADQARSLFKLAAQKHVFLMEAQKAAFLPITQQVKALVTSGKLGKIRYLDSQSSHAGAATIPWFNDLASGGGAFYGSAAYPLDYLQVLLGSAGITGVTGQSIHVGNESDRQASALISFDSTLASIFITSTFDLASQMVIHGTKGKIIIPNFWKTDHAFVTLNDQPTKRLAVKQQSEFSFEVDHVATCLQKGELVSPIMTPEITIQTCQIIETLYRKWYTNYDQLMR
ncbi:hypothetical protein BSQ39_01440 [Loigolactobacillus backii]|uniref:Gfo/Idh/MocA family protein n=1 Tax=Loigolactobacillus backii TaxID=375175 RepID=UPI000C1C8563|nr:Gfo/Idh/MocA family oxidoreductase [Loigolactobacillus backii]PIO82318.1 hypothetical protein BSQ39_01440 [Loigolactobacillus backii]